MVIRGFLKTTLLDYPEKVAATIFLGGCNMRCVFCHNMDIVEMSGGEVYSEDDILKHLSKRKGILDGVCITGGEPTLNADLPDFIKEIKKLNLLVKLDTNGTNPEMLKSLIDDKLIDYVAMDIKASFDKYDEICGRKCDLSKIKKSINLLLSQGKAENGEEAAARGQADTIDYEFRTTVVSEYHDKDEIIKIAEMLKGAKNYYFQPFKDSDFVPDHDLHAPDKVTLDTYVSILQNYVEYVHIRGID